MPDKEKIELWLDKSSRALVIAAAIAALCILVIQVLVHFPFYDESMHMRVLWRYSIGQKPGVDFFSTYPALTYLILSPILKFFPETAYLLLVFRSISVAVYLVICMLFFYHGKRTGDREAALLPLALLASILVSGSFFVEFSIDHYAALAAVGAMVLLFQEPEPRKAASASALALLSMMIMPKYIFPVFFGFLGYLYYAACILRMDARKLALTITAGAAVSALLASTVFWAYGISIIENIKYSHLLAPKMVVKKDFGHMASFIADRFVANPLYAATVLLGIAGWAKRSFRRRDAVSLAGGGVLIGVLVHCFWIKFPLEVYQAPVYLSLALFAPFTFSLFAQGTLSKAAKAVLSAAVLFSVTAHIPASAREFDQTVMNLREGEGKGSQPGMPCFKALGYYNKLLAIIPREEKIVAIWLNNPMLRLDITGTVGDDRPSFSEIIPKNSPPHRFFEPEILKAELAGKPPALIDFIRVDENYPPGWDKILADYVRANGNNYRTVISPLHPGSRIFLRADLAAKWPAIVEGVSPTP